jgi:hypothetical protein
VTFEMSSSQRSIECSEHGGAYATFVCTHLVDKPAQFWFSEVATPKRPSPDAWCKKCERAFQEYGEWNEKNDAQSRISMICNHCYAAKKLASLDQPKGAQGIWQKLVEASHHSLHQKQDNLAEEFSISKHERWDYDQHTGLLTFSNEGKPVVEAKFQVIGSVSKKTNTWMWAWANENIWHVVRRGVKAVADFGYEKQLSRLTVPLYPADEYTGWEMAGISAHLMKSKGVYRVPGENTELFLALQKIWWVK